MDSSNDKLLQGIEEELHDLCQPLTALQFRLEMGKSTGDAGELQGVIGGALEETARMIEAIKRMRERIARMKTDGTQSSRRGLRLADRMMDRGARS